MKLSRSLSERVLSAVTRDEIDAWLRDVDRHVAGLRWVPLGGIMNNIHSVEVASDSASALVERATNGIDGMLDLWAEQKAESAPTPHAAAQQWLGVPKGGISALDQSARQRLADNIQVLNFDSGDLEKPTIVIQDRGTGQHPTDFGSTFLSLGASNKKSKTHQIGVYNAGSAATYNFCPYTIIVSRRAPALLAGKTDDIGVTIVRYNPLDPDKYRSGTYEYCVDAKFDILTLDLPNNEIPKIGYGSYVKHIEYELTSYCRAAHEPKRSLHHLFHAALPDPPLPFWIEETRIDQFPTLKKKGTGERRVVSGLVARLRNRGVADYSDEREIRLGSENGCVTLRYFLLNDDQEPDAFVTPSQGLSFVLNGQRHGMHDRYWVKRNTGYNYIWNRLVILVDGDKLTSAAKRQVFSSTREASKMGPLPELVRRRVVEELKEDDELAARDEEARQRTLSSATKTASEKVKRQLADRIAAFVKGESSGTHGGGARRPRKRTTNHKPRVRPRKPRNLDDTAMLEVPDTLTIVTDPVELIPGGTASLKIYLNAKNGFLPRYGSNLTVVVGADLRKEVHLRSSGRLVGGHARLTMEASANASIGSQDQVTVMLAIPELSVALSAQGIIRVIEPDKDEQSKSHGGDVQIDIAWIGRERWADQVPEWDEQTVGTCTISRKDPSSPDTITGATWLLNEAFRPYEKLLETKRLGEKALPAFREGYQVPLCWGLFNQSLAEESAQEMLEEDGAKVKLRETYGKGERARIGQAILLAMEPTLALSIAEEGAA
jgi:hypothetical protein